MTPTAFLALVLLASAGGSSPASPAAPNAPTVRLAARGPLDGWRQELALGWHATTFWSQEDNHYTFQSFSLAYFGSFKSRGIFVHATVLDPFQAQQNGRGYGVGDYYRVHTGGDLLLGWHWRWRLHPVLEAEAGPGVHASFLWLRGQIGYRDFSALPLGLGGMGILRWRPGPHLFSWPLTLGAYASTALDLFDPLRAGDLHHGFTFRAGLVAGIQAAE